MDTPQQKQRCEANVQEYDSTRYLYQLVIRCYECLSLWKLLCEYQIHPTVAALGKVRSRDCHVTAVKSCVCVCVAGYEGTSETGQLQIPNFEWERGNSCI